MPCTDSHDSFSAKGNYHYRCQQSDTSGATNLSAQAEATVLSSEALRPCLPTRHWKAMSRNYVTYQTIKQYTLHAVPYLSIKGKDSHLFPLCH